MPPSAGPDHGASPLTTSETSSKRTPLAVYSRPFVLTSTDAYPDDAAVAPSPAAGAAGGAAGGGPLALGARLLAGLAPGDDAGETRDAREAREAAAEMLADSIALAAVGPLPPPLARDGAGFEKRGAAAGARDDDDPFGLFGGDEESARDVQMVVEGGLVQGRPADGVLAVLGRAGLEEHLDDLDEAAARGLAEAALGRRPREGEAAPRVRVGDVPQVEGGAGRAEELAHDGLEAAVARVVERRARGA